MAAKGDLREALVEAGLALLDAEAEFSLRSVARHAGVSAMAPYRHFADKEALLAAIAMRGFERLRERLLIADAVADLDAALFAQGRAYIDFALGSPALFRLMFVGTAKGELPGGETAYSVLAERVRQVVPDAPEAGVLTSWSTVHGLAMLALDQRLFGPVEPQVDAALKLLVEGLAARRR
jgi:AcrR family transcriptional regulator